MNVNSKLPVQVNNVHVLITGWCGTGKSTICRELISRGHNGFEGDDRALGLSSWVEIATEKDLGRGYPEDYTAEKYDWRWNEPAMKDLLASKEVFLCGNANNSFDFYPLFDHIFILTLTETEQRRRIMARTEHDYGQDISVQDMVIKRQASLVKQATLRGARLIDASDSPEKIVDTILAQL